MTKTIRFSLLLLLARVSVVGAQGTVDPPAIDNPPSEQDPVDPIPDNQQPPVDQPEPPEPDTPPNPPPQPTPSPTDPPPERPPDNTDSNSDNNNNDNANDDNNDNMDMDSGNGGGSIQDELMDAVVDTAMNRDRPREESSPTQEDTQDDASAENAEQDQAQNEEGGPDQTTIIIAVGSVAGALVLFAAIICWLRFAARRRRIRNNKFKSTFLTAGDIGNGGLPWMKQRNESNPVLNTMTTTTTVSTPGAGVGGKFLSDSGYNGPAGRKTSGASGQLDVSMTGQSKGPSPSFGPQNPPYNAPPMGYPYDQNQGQGYYGPPAGNGYYEGVPPGQQGYDMAPAQEYYGYDQQGAYDYYDPQGPPPPPPTHAQDQQGGYYDPAQVYPSNEGAPQQPPHM